MNMEKRKGCNTSQWRGARSNLSEGRSREDAFFFVQGETTNGLVGRALERIWCIGEKQCSWVSMTNRAKK